MARGESAVMLGSRHAPRRSLPGAAAVEEDLWSEP